jgi:hypothetical protein
MRNIEAFRYVSRRQRGRIDSNAEPTFFQNSLKLRCIAPRSAGA